MVQKTKLLIKWSTVKTSTFDRTTSSTTVSLHDRRPPQPTTQSGATEPGSGVGRAISGPRLIFKEAQLLMYALVKPRMPERRVCDMQDEGCEL